MDGATVIVVPLWMAVFTIIGGWELGKAVGEQLEKRADELSWPAEQRLDKFAAVKIHGARAQQETSANKCAAFLSRLSS